MKNKYLFLILFLSLVVIVTIALNVDSDKSGEIKKNGVQNTNQAIIPKTTETIVKNNALATAKYDEKLNKYINRSKKYSVLYPNNLDVFEIDPEGINLGYKNADGPWLINITTQENPENDIYVWLKTQNQNRGDLPPMTIKKTFKRDDTVFLYLNNPISVDQKDGKPVYASTDTVVAIKNGQLFKIIKRELWNETNKPTTFDIVVENFKIL